MPKDMETIADGTSTDLGREFSESGRHPCLIVLAGTEAGRVIPLSPGTHVVGRTDDASITIPHSSVSRRHAEIIVANQRSVFVRDLGSTNGTRVNGAHIGESRHALSVDDRISLSKRVVLKYNLQDSLESELHEDLYSSSVRDGLTGAFNKRFLLERMEEEFSHAKRHQRSLSLMVLDIDHFKKVNDTFGHSAGDQVLVMTAEHIMGQLRAEDILARYGGEEFVVVMRDTDLPTATRIGERLREGLMAQTVMFEGTPIQITVSIGITAMPPMRASSAMEFFVRADRLLYQAKNSGRNRVFTEVRQEE